MSFVIPVWVDYGAIEVLWYSPFDNMEIIISWWEDQESIDIYKYKTDLQAAKAILPNGIIVKVTTHKESDFFYKIHAEKKSFLCLITITHRTYPLKERNIFIKESLIFLLLHLAFKRIQKT
ncbi:hypothetical protein [Acinetobacter bereziniae]|uniref:hypothetical protein n=1 Tax=Acinetobacter bereziniae TaxID=106648 RepID=UPI0021CFCA36|nr:hypothetical protein [Acinetobacter bereziniae]